MVTIIECTRQNLSVDCTDDRCFHAGDIQADCPKYECDRPKELKLLCDRCGFIKGYQKSMRAEYDKK